MTFKLTDLIAQVRIALDQNQVELTLLAPDENTLQLDDIARQKLSQAGKWLLERAPLSMIDLHKPMLDAGTPTDDDGRLAVPLPADWLRLWVARVDTWQVPVRGTVPAESEFGLLAASEFAGVRPGAERPLVLEGAGELTLCGSKGVVAALEYVPLPRVDSNKTEFPVLLVDALVWLAASLVCDTYGDARGAALRAMALGAAGIAADNDTKKTKQ